MGNHWLDKSEYPFQSKFWKVNGQQLHYIDEGKGEPMLFVHGTPSWSFDYRNVIKKLKSDFRCIAIDHIGFGLSDKPENYDYTTQNHSKTLQKFVFEKQLEDFILVVHDFGAVIALNFALQYPEKVKGMVVLNSWFWSSMSDPEFVKIRNVLKSPLLPFLYRYLNFSPRFIFPRSFGDRKIPGKLLKQYTKPFANKAQRNGPLAFAKSLLNDQDWFEELWNQRNILANIPTLFIWGIKDPVIKPHYLEKFQRGFPNSTTIRLETSGHFPQEEQPDAVANAMIDFLNGQCNKNGA